MPHVSTARSTARSTTPAVGLRYAGMWARQDLLDKYGFDWQNTKTVEDWEPYFDQTVANEPDVVPLVSTDGYWGRTWFPNYYGYDPVDKGIGAPQAQGIIGVKAGRCDA